MSKARYQITEVSPGLYDLFEDNLIIARFSRKSFREDLQILGRGDGWIGSILRLFNRAYPALAAARINPAPPIDDILHSLGERGIADYLRYKGYTVYKRLDVPDETLINLLLARGYVVEASEGQSIPLTSTRLTDSNISESAHSGSRSLCAVGEVGMGTGLKVSKNANGEAEGLLHKAGSRPGRVPFRDSRGRGSASASLGGLVYK